VKAMAGLARLLDRERGRLARYVRARLYRISSMDVEDIVSDVIFGLLRRADVAGEVENLMAYAYRALENRIIDFRRAARDTISLDETALDAEALDVDAPALVAGGETPERAVARLEMRDRLLWALGRLSPGERAVWVATEIDGLSFREVAEQWDEPLGTLLSRKSRASARLRALLAEHHE